MPDQAKRGMVVVHVNTVRDYIIGQPTVERTEAHIGVATSVTRDGIVRRYRRFDWNAEVDGPAEVKRFRGQMLLVPNVCAQSAEQAARAHTWPGHPDQPRYFDSLDEVRALLKPLRQVTS